MLRHGDKVRLTATEREFVSVAVGRDVNPKSVDEYNGLWTQPMRFCWPRPKSAKFTCSRTVSTLVRGQSFESWPRFCRRRA